MANSFAESKLIFRAIEADMWEDEDIDGADIMDLDGKEITRVSWETGEHWDVSLACGTQLHAIHGMHIVLEPV